MKSNYSLLACASNSSHPAWLPLLEMQSPRQILALLSERSEQK